MGAAAKSVDEGRIETHEAPAGANRHWLSIRAAAKAAGLSESTLRRAIADGLVAAERQGATVRLTQQTVLELRTGTGIKRQGPSLAAREADAQRGEVAANAFSMFANGAQLIEVVQELRQDPDVVDRLWHKWIALQETYMRSVAPRCLHAGPDCEGAPRPDAMLCLHHAEASRPLSPEQIAMLDGAAIPTAVKCSSCGKMAGRGMCSRCVSSLSVSVEGGRIAIRSGKDVLAIVPLEASRTIAKSVLDGPES